MVDPKQEKVEKLKLIDYELNLVELGLKVNVLNKSHWKNSDIQIVMDCGKTKASGYRALIEDYIKTVLKKDVPSQIPSKVAIKVLDIDDKKIRENYKFTLEVTNRGSKESQQHPSFGFGQTVQS